MPGPDESDKGLKTPPGAQQEATPHGKEPAPRTSIEFGPSDPRLAVLQERYDQLAELGRGGMGVVYRARDRETDEVVALKLLLPEVASRPDLIERFKAELRLARKITHKNVCRVYELNHLGAVAAISMEYVAGESLRTVLQRPQGISARYGLKVLRQVIAGLAEAHAQGVVHRDLKPENILIARDGTVKVMDFGIARSLEVDATQTTTGMFVGTPSYMSPEQAEGRAIDARSDIYSLGLVMYELFTGQQAFLANTPLAYGIKQVHETPAAPSSIEPDLPERIEQVIEKCLEKDPAKRFQNIEEVLVALEERPAAALAAAPAELPAHLRTYQRSDLALVAVGIAGLVAFLLTLPVVSPDTSQRFQFLPGMLVQKGQAELLRRGWEPARNATIHVLSEERLGRYLFLAERVGYAHALDAVRKDAPLFFFRVRFRSRDDPKILADMTFDLNGAMHELALPVESWVPQGQALERDQARELASQELRQQFDLDPAQLVLEKEEPLREGSRNGFAFQWVQIENNGLRHLYRVHAFDRVTQVKRTAEPPSDYKPPRRGLYIAATSAVNAAVWLLAVVVFFLSRLYRNVKWRHAATLSVPCILAGVGMALPVSYAVGFEQGPDLVYFMFLFVLLAYTFSLLAWTFPFVYATQHLTRRPSFHQTSSFIAVLEGRPLLHPTALAVARGAAGGFAALGIYALVRWLGVAAGVSWPRLLELQVSRIVIDSAAPAVTLLGFGVVSGLGTALSLALFLAFLRRWLTSALLLAVSGGFLMLGLSALPRPVDASILIAYFAVGVVFAILLRAFDLLTVVFAALTFVLWPSTYGLVRMYELVGNGQFWVVLALWTAVVAWGALVGYGSLWTRLGRRFAASVD